MTPKRWIESTNAVGIVSNINKIEEIKMEILLINSKYYKIDGL
jgi:hypothetical protein